MFEVVIQQKQEQICSTDPDFLPNIVKNPYYIKSGTDAESFDPGGYIRLGDNSVIPALNVNPLDAESRTALGGLFRPYEEASTTNERIDLAGSNCTGVFCRGSASSSPGLDWNVQISSVPGFDLSVQRKRTPIEFQA